MLIKGSYNRPYSSLLVKNTSIAQIKLLIKNSTERSAHTSLRTRFDGLTSNFFFLFTILAPLSFWRPLFFGAPGGATAPLPHLARPPLIQSTFVFDVYDISLETLQQILWKMPFLRAHPPLWIFAFDVTLTTDTTMQFFLLQNNMTSDNVSPTARIPCM